MKIYKAIGLMSGTSLDGVDVAYIETDGAAVVRRLGYESYAYGERIRDGIRAALRRRNRDATVLAAEKLVTDEHVRAVERFLKAHPDAGMADVIGFHGQTIYHNPSEKVSVQIGDAKQLAKRTGINVVSDFRTADVKAGGQGAPFLPLYHQALAAKLKKPLAVVNIGGVANVTWIGDDEILAFDTGPGNALIDDFVKKRTGKNYDKDGALARSGKAQEALLYQWFDNPFFKLRPPKSLDRDAWSVLGVEKLSDEDGAATLTEFTVRAIAKSLEHFPEKPRRWYVSGGGRHNKAIMKGLKKHLGWSVDPVERRGWDGGAMEAEGFAYLAVRSLLGLPLSLPTTTGVPKPLSGGVYTRA